MADNETPEGEPQSELQILQSTTHPREPSPLQVLRAYMDMRSQTVERHRDGIQTVKDRRTDARNAVKPAAVKTATEARISEIEAETKPQIAGIQTALEEVKGSVRIAGSLVGPGGFLDKTEKAQDLLSTELSGGAFGEVQDLDKGVEALLDTAKSRQAELEGDLTTAETDQKTRIASAPAVVRGELDGASLRAETDYENAVGARNKETKRIRQDGMQRVFEEIRDLGKEKGYQLWSPFQRFGNDVLGLLSGVREGASQAWAIIKSHTSQAHGQTTSAELAQAGLYAERVQNAEDVLANREPGA